MPKETKENRPESKTDLIKVIKKHVVDGRLVGKILRQIKLAKNSENAGVSLAKTINWDILESSLLEIVDAWQNKLVGQTVNQFLEEIRNILKKGGSVAFRNNFGLRVYRTMARVAYNPQTKKKMTIGAHNRVSFRVSQKLKREINS